MKYFNTTIILSVLLGLLITFLVYYHILKPDSAPVKIAEEVIKVETGVNIDEVEQELFDGR